MFKTLVILLAATAVHPPVSEPPTDAEILRAMPAVNRNVPFVFEEFRDDIVIVKNRLAEKNVGQQRFVPLFGKVQLVATNWECVVYYTETTKVLLPLPLELSKARVQVIYIEKVRLAD